MKKVLFVASVSGHIRAFHLPYLEWFRKKGYQVDVAARLTSELPSEYNFHNIPFERSPFKKSNISAYKQLKMLICENKYDIIHCHTPVASILTRLAARKARKNGTKVIYTAHGFHFFKGSSKKNWMIFYPIEKLCSKWTDVLITINKEDYEFAKKKVSAKSVEYVPGVGIDLKKFSENKLSEVEKKELRASLGIEDHEKLLFSVGELNDNKNHIVILKAMQKLPCNVKYYIAGKGGNEKKLLDLAQELGIGERFLLLGHRNDIATLMQAADIFCFPSRREGLPVSLMEAMACGIPCVASRIRGNVDLIEDGKGGYLCESMDANAFAEKINEILENADTYKMMSDFNKEKVKAFSIETVAEKMNSLYSL